LRILELTLSGTINAVAPKTSAILVMFEPKALPTASDGLPPEAAKAATSISGAEVPKPTIVRPIINGETPKLRAVAEAPSTKKSALQINKAKPARMATMSIKISTPTYTKKESAMIHDSTKQSEQTAANLKLGCYGWNQAHWGGSYYPEDLPEDWRLSYYANDYGCVLVPADYCLHDDIEDWLDEVHEAFRFYFEWPQDPALQAAVVSASEILQPQLGGILVDAFIAGLDVEQFIYQQKQSDITIWQPGMAQSSNVAGLETIKDIDLRQQREYLQAFDQACNHKAAAILIKDQHCDHQTLTQMQQLIEMLGL